MEDFLFLALVKENFAKLTDEQRLEVISDYCIECMCDESDGYICYCGSQYDV